ncbi:MAG: pyrroline-5-carboxylate reductase [Oscillibacter sp.]|nr:pyrroline-5-carboxylate reductase [Oscillibacter sp.]
MKYGFIGLGNMGGAILRGMRASERFQGSEIYAYGRSVKSDLAQNLANAAEVCRAADVVVFAVKPQVLEGVLKGVARELAGKLVVSVAAGKTLAFLENCLGEGARIVRVMPNINAAVLSSTSAFCASASATEEDRRAVREIFETIGSVIELEEKHFSAFSAIAGCSPAFTYMYIDALARAAVRAGMPRETALSAAASAVLGSAKMVTESGEPPMQLCDRVCSPGGTTIEGVMRLRALGFEDAVHEAVKAAIEKDRTL